MDTRALLALPLALTSLAAAPLPADLLVVGGRLQERPGADAVLVRQGRIVALGAAPDLRRGFRGPVLDAAGGLVLPGFHDSHLHLESAGAALEGVDVSETDDVAAVQGKVRAQLAAHPEAAWILGRGWGYDVAGEGVRPDRHMLDAAVADTPVLLESYDGHAYWANSRALEAMGFGADTPNPEGGEIVREADGRTPAGMLLEAAGGMAERAVPAPGRAVRSRRIRRAADQLLDLGVTACEDMSYAIDAPGLYAELAGRGQLPLRVGVWLPLGTPPEEVRRQREAYPGPWVRVMGVKGFLDGVIESHTALMVDPYVDRPTRGSPARAESWLRQQVLAAMAAGVPVTLHCVGDGAVRLALDLYQEGRRRNPSFEGPLRVEHLEVVHPEDLARFQRLGVVASMQPYHAVPSDQTTDDGPWARPLGPARLEQSFPWRSLALARAPLAFGSDWPVMSADPLWGLAVASTRRNRRGLPAAGWHPGQALPWRQALSAYGLGAARAAGVEASLGRVAPGYLADLVVLAPGVDPARPASLWEGARVAAVVVGGRVQRSRGPPSRAAAGPPEAARAR